MDKLRDFYFSLTDRKKKVFWACLALVFLSIVRLASWQFGKGGVPRPSSHVRRLSSDNPEEKRFAIYEAGRLEIKSAVPALVKIIREDADMSFKLAAAASLAQINKARLVELLDEKQEDVKRAVMETLLKVDRSNISLLLDRFDKEDAETKAVILSYAKFLTDPAYRDKMLLIAENEKEDTGIRTEALRIAANLGLDPQAESRLWNLYYNDPEKEVKEAAYRLIRQAGR